MIVLGLLIFKLWDILCVQVIQMNIEESARRQIAQELKINQSSQCPYVVVCYQSFYNNGVISIILEYMDGGSLADLLKNVKTIPEEYLAAICKQVENYIQLMNSVYKYNCLSVKYLSFSLSFFDQCRCLRGCCIFTMKNTLSTGI